MSLHEIYQNIADQLIAQARGGTSFVARKFADGGVANSPLQGRRNRSLNVGFLMLLDVGEKAIELSKLVVCFLEDFVTFESLSEVD